MSVVLPPQQPQGAPEPLPEGHHAREDASGAQNRAGVFVRPTCYEVTAWPGPIDGVNRSHYVLYVEWRGDDRWCVTDGSWCYRKDGHKAYERNPSSRTDRFKNAYRFSLDEALALAQRVAPKIRIGAGPNRKGMNAAEMWEWEQAQ